MLNFAIHGYQGARGNPGQEFKGQTKCDALLLVEKVIFCQSIPKDDGAWRASMLYYCLIQYSYGTWVREKAYYGLIFKLCNRH